MKDQILIVGIQRKDEEAFEMLIDKYSSYVSVIISNVANGSLSSQDIEELAADVFVAVWNKVDKIDLSYYSIKPYLAAMARNMTRSRLRLKKVVSIPLEDDILIISDEHIQTESIQREQREIINKFVETFSQPDREIFIRYYFFYQKVRSISEQLNINESTVKTKLSRCRDKLKQYLIERGYEFEN